MAGTKFLLSESSRVQYVEIYNIVSRKLEKLVPLIKREVNRYIKQGLQVCGVHIDNEFNSEIIEEAVKPAVLHKYTVNEYVSVIERCNRTVKDRMQSIIAGLPYSKIPKAMLVGIAKLVKKMLNRFLMKQGLCTLISPAALLDGQQDLDLLKKRITLGAYAQVWIGTKNNKTEGLYTELRWTLVMNLVAISSSV